eukprot:m.107319 g.107319  ORF g.107319 m.107319 type:complete len:53 (-) comp15843_c1_seq2:1306-1464(-)
MQLQACNTFQRSVLAYRCLSSNCSILQKMTEPSGCRQYNTSGHSVTDDVSFS